MVLCRALLASVDASEGRRKRRKRDTTPDAIGLAIKRALLEAAMREDPEPAAFEGRLLERCLDPPSGASVGSMRAMALDVLAEWRLCQASTSFRDWLARGAPSAEASEDASPSTARDAFGR